MIAKRYLKTLGGIAAVSLLAAGCSTPASPDEPGQTELSMIVNVTPNLTEEWWNELVAPFEEAHPEIDVIIQNPGAEGVAAAIPRLLASGDAPDIVQSLPPTTELAPELVDLSGYEWASSGPLSEQYSIDGKHYMAGIGIQLQSLMFYNKAAFEEAGIDAPPTTLDELDDALGRLKAAGWTPLQTGGDWMSSHLLQVIGLPTVIAENEDWFAKMSSGELTFSQTYGSSVERYADWVAQGYIPTDDLGVKYPDAEQNFLGGNSAIYSMGSWFAGTEANTPNAPEIGVFRAPAADGVSNPAMGANIASPYLIMKSSEHQEAAAQLVEFLTTDETAVVDQLKVDGNFRDGYSYETTALGDELGKIVADTPAADYTPTGQGYGERTLPSGYSDEINAQTQALLGGAAPADVLSAMDSWFSANIS